MKYFIGILVVFVLFISVFIFVYQNSFPVSNDDTLRNFVINQGDGLNVISTRLQSNNFIRNKFVFLLFTRTQKVNNNLQAGLFRLSSSMSTSEIITKLSTGGSYDFWLKIIPGTRIEEISSKFTFNPELEGYLFPDSYLIPEYFTASETEALIKKNFDEKISSFNINKNNLPTIITLASLLEREAKTKTDRQMVAGIINNRLKIGMALQIDAAVQYARDSKNHPAKYWQVLSKTDLKINSPFNTYLNPGLPPSPICNPSLDSIYAAINPTSSDYIYYIHGTDGKMYFAKTLAEHNSNVSKYLR
jgi:UPF0755 protein